MKRIKAIITLVMGLTMMLNITGYASELSREDIPGNHETSILLPEGVLSSQDEYHAIARGDFLSSGALDITNRQNGTIFISIDTYAHHDVDSIFHTVFLDQWDTGIEDWRQVGYWDFTKTKEETADGKLSYLVTSFTVSGYPTGKYYRLRGLHGVEYNDEIEATATETDGVLITDGPT